MRPRVRTLPTAVCPCSQGGDPRKQTAWDDATATWGRQQRERSRTARPPPPRHRRLAWPRCCYLQLDTGTTFFKFPAEAETPENRGCGERSGLESPLVVMATIYRRREISTRDTEEKERQREDGRSLKFK